MRRDGTGAGRPLVVYFHGGVFVLGNLDMGPVAPFVQKNI
jgi:acetyl esterase/lipase